MKLFRTRTKKQLLLIAKAGFQLLQQRKKTTAHLHQPHHR
jgi:hypothetical protein